MRESFDQFGDRIADHSREGFRCEDNRIKSVLAGQGLLIRPAEGLHQGAQTLGRGFDGGHAARDRGSGRAFPPRVFPE